MSAAALQRLWRYSLRWSNPYTQPPEGGPVELLSVTVPAGSPTPAEIKTRWRPGVGYAICLDFDNASYEPQAGRQWSPERKGKVRVKRLQSRLGKAFPLFADELLERELQARPDYYSGAAPR